MNAMPRSIRIFAAIFTMAFFMPSLLLAGEAILPIRVGLVQCGETKADIPRACRADDRCCAFMDQTPPEEITKEEYVPVRMTTIEDFKIEGTGPEKRAHIEEKPQITAIVAQPAPKPAPIAVLAPPPVPTLKPLLAKTKLKAPKEVRIAINIWDYVQ